jgi:hypothetical protein
MPDGEKRGTVFTYISNDDAKVFGIGLSRTGTTSLNKALQLLGLNAFHWNFPPQNRLLTLEDAYFCDAITDINAAWNFDLLARVFPNARFVYTTRPLDDWERSVARHYHAKTPAILKRRLSKTPVLKAATGPNALTHDPLYHAIHHALYTGHDSWRGAYLSHNARVQAFFEAAPERLLTINVFEGEQDWTDLCKFLGRRAPDVPYPHVSWKSPEPATSPAALLNA